MLHLVQALLQNFNSILWNLLKVWIWYFKNYCYSLLYLSLLLFTSSLLTVTGVYNGDICLKIHSCCRQLFLALLSIYFVITHFVGFAFYFCSCIFIQLGSRSPWWALSLLDTLHLSQIFTLSLQIICDPSRY